MLVFAALTPHSPLLLPTVGKEHTARLQATAAAFATLEQHLYAAKPDTIVIVTPHGPKSDASFSINFAPRFTAHFEEFSDLTTKAAYPGDTELSYRIKERLETAQPVFLHTHETLDYGTSLPLHFLARHLKNVAIIPVATSHAPYADHFAFGAALREELLETNKRVAVIASMEFASRLSKLSPAGYHPSAKKFDQKLLDAIKNKDVEALLAIKPEQAERAGAVDVPALVTLSGILDGTNYTPVILSYEGPFGIGHAVVEYRL